MAIPIISSILKRVYVYRNPKLAFNWKGIKFPNRVGLAAGFDKNADYVELLTHLGFGFIEVGTVTPKPQEGNPKPRLFRLPKDESLINRMGFNNNGIDAMVQNLKNIRKRNTDVIIGGNIGKNKITPNEEALNDYLICFEAIYSYVDYFVVNVSSPNTPNLRALQEKEPLTKLLQTLIDRRVQYSESKPILLKIAPDLNDHLLQDIIDISNELKLDGIIAANTTIDRSLLSYTAEHVESIGAGGLSGKVMKDKSTSIISKLKDQLNKETLIIGVGGIDGPQEAQEKLNAGADLIQVYTGMVYQGPKLIKRINKSLAKNN